jgi:hypothetical protein
MYLMRLRTRSMIVAATAGFALGAGGAGTALAKAHRPLIGRGSVFGTRSAVTNPTSGTLAGYTATLSGGADATASITFRVPAFQCAADDSTPMVGELDGLLDANGSQVGVGGVTFACATGQYTLIAQGAGGLTSDDSNDVNARDLVTVTATADTTNGSVIVVDDQTSGGIAYVQDPTATNPVTTLLQGLLDSTGGSIPKFAPLSFTNALVNGQPLSASSPTATDLQSNADIQAHTSALAKNGAGFTVTFKHRS